MFRQKVYQHLVMRMKHRFENVAGVTLYDRDRPRFSFEKKNILEHGKNPTVSYPMLKLLGLPVRVRYIE